MAGLARIVGATLLATVVFAVTAPPASAQATRPGAASAPTMAAPTRPPDCFPTCLRIQVVNTNNCLIARGLANGGVAVVFNCEYWPDQYWYRDWKSSNSSYRLRNAFSNKCLALHGYFGQPFLAPCDAYPDDQHWQFAEGAFSSTWFLIRNMTYQTCIEPNGSAWNSLFWGDVCNKNDWNQNFKFMDIS